MKAKETGLAALTLLILGLLAYLWFAPSALQSAAPELSLQTLDGRILKLSELRGRPVLVNFWATTCPGCVKEMPHLVELYQRLAPQGLEVIGIAMSYDPPNQVATLVRARGLPYTIALDLDGKAAEAFGKVRLTPTSFLISPQGRIVSQKIGELDMAAVERSILELIHTNKN